MSTTNRALRALCISAVATLVVAGTAAATSLHTPLGQHIPLHSGETLNRATQVLTFSGARHRGAMRPLHSWMSARAKSGKKLIYVSDQEFNDINVYPADVDDPAPIGTITSGLETPDGLTLDASGNLYVTNAGGNTVAVYPPGSITPNFTYAPGANPNSVIVGSDNVVYISQGIEGCICVSEYNVGGSSVLRTIQLDETGGAPMELALDANNNLYVTLTNATVYEFAPGATVGTNLGLLGLSNPRGIGIDRKGDLAVADDIIFSDPNFVDVFPPGATTMSRQLTVGPQPFEIAFGKKMRRLYVASVSYGFYGNVVSYDYRNMRVVDTISTGLEQPLGVAFTADVR